MKEHFFNSQELWDTAENKNQDRSAFLSASYPTASDLMDFSFLSELWVIRECFADPPSHGSGLRVQWSSSGAI